MYKTEKMDMNTKFLPGRLVLIFFASYGSNPIASSKHLY